ncbi:MAG: CRISPR-associated helicase Cas3' [Actinomycetota bacterium]
MMHFPLYAHTPNKSGQWHLLVDHLRATAERAESFGAVFEAGEVARTVGWLHDVGKCSSTFAAYLQVCANEGSSAGRMQFPARDHKSAGALRASRLPGTGGLLAGTILGHHGGLHDWKDVKSMTSDASQHIAVGQALARFDASIGNAPFELTSQLPSWAGDATTSKADVEMLGRLIFSCLVDADFLDTEGHFDQSLSSSRRGGRDLTGLLEGFEKRRRTILATATGSPVNQARSEMYQTVISRSARAPGIYKLAAPTGSGKTHMGLGWALAHAQANNLRQIVTAVPFISVTDQVAQVYRGLLEDGGGRVVLEHHSQIVEDSGWQRLASENWDTPVTVTTTVRLFESLFSNRTSDCRRLHRLARSVIVLDEAQAIPIEVIEPVFDGLRALVDRFGASVLIMTATQPALEFVKTTQGRPAIDLLPEVDNWKEPFTRTSISLIGKPAELDHAQVASMVTNVPQCLCILNTIGDARKVTEATGDPDVIHLSTMLRPCDRVSRLQSIRTRLLNGTSCRVVSTQLVEAGVDLDFPVVLRAMAPLPSLAQADGRCNRNGSLGAAGGKMIVFDLVDGKQPPGGYYSQGTAHSHTILLTQPDFRTPQAVASWYGLLLTDASVTQDARNVQESRKHFDYRTTAERFRMIEDATVGVAVSKGHPEERRFDELLDRLRDHDKLVSREELRALQAITVSVKRALVDRAQKIGLAEPINEFLHRWVGVYDHQVGLILDGSIQSELIW